MQIDYCLILAAGFGSRMGSIGKELPKVLWPVFEKSLLELQVAYARSLGIKKIYINLHFLGEAIHTRCEQLPAFEGVTFLWEKPEILDIGGAIHNLASRPEVNYAGKLLVLNADQFFYLRPEELERYLSPFTGSPAVLFSYLVNSSLGYNALDVAGDRSVKSIKLNKDITPNQTIETYTGVSWIDLAQLERVPGVSKFFESVCPIERRKIPAVLLENIDYWDFGTIKRYWDTSFSILATYRANSNHPFLRFLVAERALKTWKINLNNFSYHAKSQRVINLAGNEEVRDLNACIILKESRVEKVQLPTIWWGSLSDDVK